MGIKGSLTDLAELKRLAEAASVESPGAPWAYEPHGDTGEYGVGVLVNQQGNYVEGRQGSGEMSVVVPVAPEVSEQVFAAFIAAANPSAVLALIAENERNEKNAAEWEAASLHWMAERDQLKAENEALRKAVTGAIKYVAFAFDQGFEGAEVVGLAMEDAVARVGQL